MTQGETRRLGPERAAVAGRLLSLGRRGVGGFTSAGEDAGGVLLERAPADPTLAAWLRDHPGPIPWRRAAEIAASLANALAACEEASLFPGPLSPAGVSVRGGRAEIRADALVAALTGEPAPKAPRPSTSARWIAPEQAAGAEPDSAGNRYALGLLLYRMLAGAHPFSGRGLRLDLEDRAQRGAPPFPDEIAETLPPGLQSLCLRTLDPDPSRRPESAAALARSLGAFIEGDVAIDAGAHVGALPTADEPAPSSDPVQPERPVPRRVPPALLFALPLPLGLALAAFAFGASDPPSSARAPTSDSPRAPIPDPHAAASECATCHPRQTSEWRRSVMAHASRSPLFQALEILIQEQVGRDDTCPGGAGVLREADPATACRDRSTGLAVTGSGGELWCVNCHAPGENLRASLPAWDGRSRSSATRLPLGDLLPEETLEGISCAFCHQTSGRARPGNLAAGLYEGNPSWTSPRTGRRFSMRPEDLRGRFGIANSGYFLDPNLLLPAAGDPRPLVAGGAHARPTESAKSYLSSSDFCGACHDVRLFGTDVLGASRGEHFKRLRNAYSEWRAWAAKERRAGRVPASCQDCHMSTYPGVCLPGPSATPTAADGACPPGTHFEPRPPGAYPRGRAAAGAPRTEITSHYFSGVDVPLSSDFPERAVDDPTLDPSGIPLGARQRRDLLLARSLSLQLDAPGRAGARLEVPVVVENVGAGHKIPAGFSQEREIWVHLSVTDADGDTVYEVGRIERADQDLRDKVFLRVQTDPGRTDAAGRPIGLFGADVADGPEVPAWSPSPELGGTEFRGRGLINFQNGFLRCVRCIGRIDERGRCRPLPGQRGHRAARYADGDYDPDTGACRSNLRGRHALLETYFPIGALDASRGAPKGPDAIIDTRSLSPGEPVRYVYDLAARDRRGPFTVRARLLFRAFPPFLIKAFADYEKEQSRRGRRPSGPLVTRDMLRRLEVVELATASATIR